VIASLAGVVGLLAAWAGGAAAQPAAGSPQQQPPITPQPPSPSGDAPAQQIAADPPKPDRPDPPHPPSGLGGTFTVGLAGMSGAPTGWLVRLDYEAFPVLAPHDVTGPIFGFLVGWEVWRAQPDWGLSLPVGIVLGVRAQPVRATFGFGVDALIVDVVDDDTGVGFYAPFACARVGLDVLGFQLGADARVARRWQIGAPDHTQWQIGAFIGRTWESKDRRPRY
jgi:hypothetical protein